MGKKLIVINRLSPERIAAISEAVPGSSVESYDSVAAAVPHVSDADALAVWGFTDIRPLLEAAPHIKWVHSLSDGVEKLLCPPLLENPIALTNSRGIHDKPVAEHIMALLLAWTRKIPDAVRSQDKHEWKRLKAGSVYGKTAVIAGFGGIGRAAAERAKSFGIKIIAVKNTVLMNFLQIRFILQQNWTRCCPKQIISSVPFLLQKKPRLTSKKSISQ